MNNQDRYRLAKFTVSTRIEDAHRRRFFRRPSPLFEIVACALVGLIFALL